ncbi:DUF2304 domain-containing protein [Candidatus Woesearchaeota archaeon]|nr:MAG: hypothetical protein QS99_C0007G0006 [archaeon GW2011_AR4]MBS3129417.1 DUF2304 domain-containing protein [Candidatus Woesearchaeota archaeon]HIH38458.1 DUF2304 domain-containing protein [Candidatus Woesearchaeota archaeon]HIH49802.1 DUF2304 domain-containing protein [Candidatus Woesearchaeota archaeon]HIJ03471.1 DUF2304 domain-containing protein [Candidatus Woesearchaeota archaeon]
MVLGIQVAGVCFALFMLYITYTSSKKKQFTAKEWVFWSLIWVMIGLISLFPELLDSVVKRFHFARALDVIIIGGFIFLLGIMFYQYTVIRKCQRSIEELVRKVALEKEQR